LARKDKTQIIGARAKDSLRRRKIRLEVFVGPDAGAAAVAGTPVLQVGTQQGNTLRLTDDAVSRIHIEVSSAGSSIRIRDLASTNGTWLVGNIRVADATVPSGTVVRVGHTQLRLEALDEISEQLSVQPGFGQLVGESPLMREVFALLERVAPTDETVLITGETGTGKEICAHSIVAASRRAHGPMVVVDCGAIPPNLLESELFGHARGAFTGAVSDYQGAFERANGGTIFLDEIGELPLELQTRLLRAVENRHVRRVGDTAEIPLDIRIIAATNRGLEAEVNAGSFRADLYYRLSVVQVRIPPLRDHLSDTELLARHLLQELEVDPHAILNEEVLGQLRQYRWPGNVRELRNYLRRMLLGGINPELGASSRTASSTNQSAPEIDTKQPFKDAKEEAIAHFEREYLSALLDETGGNISAAARQAQTDRTYLSRLLVKHGLR